MSGRPRTTIGTYDAVYVRRIGDRCIAETRFRDLDGRLRKVTATAGSPSAAKALLKDRLLNRVGWQRWRADLGKPVRRPRSALARRLGAA